MIPFSYKESFPGSGVTESGMRITFSNTISSNSPAAVARIERAKDAWENGLKEIHFSCMRTNAVRRNRSRFRKICASIKEEISDLIYYNS